MRASQLALLCPTRSRASAAALGLALGLALGCPEDPRAFAPPTVIATVGETKLPQSRFVAELARMGTARLEGRAAREAVARDVLERLIREELLYQAAAEAGTKVDPRDVEREVRRSAEGYPPGVFLRILAGEQLTLEQYEEQVRRRLVIDAFLARRMKALPRPNEAEVRARYEASIAGRTKPPQVRARQVLVRTEEEATHLLDEIRARRWTLAEVAQRFSVAPEKDRGGDLGWFAEGDMPPVFEACFSLRPGDVSDVVSSEYGFHIFEVTERREAYAEPFEEAKGHLEAELRRARERDHLDAIVAKRRREVPVTLDEVALTAALTLLPAEPPEERRGPDPLPEAAFEAPPREGRAAAPEEAR